MAVGIPPVRLAELFDGDLADDLALSLGERRESANLRPELVERGRQLRGLRLHCLDLFGRLAARSHVNQLTSNLRLDGVATDLGV